MPAQTVYGFEDGSAALSIENGKKALICFDSDIWYYGYNRCEVFDGESSISTYQTNFGHWGGKLALYKGNPTTVGHEFGWKRNAVESLSPSGWSILDDFSEMY